MLEAIRKYFEFERLGTDMRTEIAGGLTTFMTMAYIIFVNPGILQAAGMDFASVMTATCLASALATLVMALAARYPIALAPGMGLNAFFAFEIVKGFNVPWQTALGMVFVSGIIFLGLTFIKAREMLINAIPESLKTSIAAGIGIFIAFIGLKNAGVIVDDPVTLVRLGDLNNTATMISLAAIALTAGMMAAGIKGAVLFGILAAGIMGVVSGLIKPAEGVGFWGNVISMKPALSATAFKLDIFGVFSRWELVALTFVLLFFDLFDTVGTLVGVSERAGFLDDEGKLPRATRALTADAVGTIGGALLGTSTTTSYIESAAGVAAGARTGFAGIITALLFIAAVFFSPLVGLFAKEFVTAPALVVVGCLMMGSVRKVDWEDFAQALPAFFTMIIMPLTFSISKGLVAGFVTWPILMAASGRYKEVHPFMFALSGGILAAVVLSMVLL